MYDHSRDNSKDPIALKATVRANTKSLKILKHRKSKYAIEMYY